MGTITSKMTNNNIINNNNNLLDHIQGSKDYVLKDQGKICQAQKLIAAH